MENTKELEFYYAAYITQKGQHGGIVIPQVKHADGENPDGFNFIEATKYLIAQFKMSVVVVSWRQVTQKRAEEFNAFVQLLHVRQGTHLQVVKGTLDDHTPVSTN